MFQYATGRALADHHHCELKLDLTDFANYNLRQYELDNYNIRASIASENDIAYFRKNRPILKKIQKIFKVSPPNVYLERDFTFDPTVLKSSSPLYLDGYWQSEKYFSMIRSALLDDFTLRATVNNKNQRVLDNINTSQAVSLHIRRGDYVADPNTNKYHGTCPLDYYHDAVSFIGERVENPEFFIFSDDTDWVKKNLSIDYPLTIVDINSPDQGILDMALMKACQHHIVANSSFSWWGAWLNPLQEKMVIAPKRWFNEVKKDTKDLIPAAWIKL